MTRPKNKKPCIPKVGTDLIAAGSEKGGSSPAGYIDDLLMTRHLGHLDGVDSAKCVNGEPSLAGMLEDAKELVCQEGCGEGKDWCGALFECDIAGGVWTGDVSKAWTSKVVCEMCDAGCEVCCLCCGVWWAHVERRKPTSEEEHERDEPRLGLGFRWN